MEATACTSTAIVVAAPVTDPSAIAACDFVDPPCEVPAGFAPGLARIIALTSSDLRHTWRLHAWSMKSCCASETPRLYTRKCALRQVCTTRTTKVGSAIRVPDATRFPSQMGRSSFIAITRIMFCFITDV